MIAWLIHGFFILLQAALVVRYWLVLREDDSRRAKRYDKEVARSKRFEFERWRKRQAA